MQEYMKSNNNINNKQDQLSLRPLIRKINSIFKLQSQQFINIGNIIKQYYQTKYHNLQLQKQKILLQITKWKLYQHLNLQRQQQKQRQRQRQKQKQTHVIDIIAQIILNNSFQFKYKFTIKQLKLIQQYLSNMKNNIIKNTTSIESTNIQKNKSLKYKSQYLFQKIKQIKIKYAPPLFPFKSFQYRKQNHNNQPRKQKNNSSLSQQLQKHKKYINLNHIIQLQKQPSKSSNFHILAKIYKFIQKINHQRQIKYRCIIVDQTAQIQALIPFNQQLSISNNNVEITKFNIEIDNYSQRLRLNCSQVKPSNFIILDQQINLQNNVGVKTQLIIEKDRFKRKQNTLKHLQKQLEQNKNRQMQLQKQYKIYGAKMTDLKNKNAFKLKILDIKLLKNNKRQYVVQDISNIQTKSKKFQKLYLCNNFQFVKLNKQILVINPTLIHSINNETASGYQLHQFQNTMIYQLQSINQLNYQIKMLKQKKQFKKINQIKQGDRNINVRAKVIQIDKKLKYTQKCQILIGDETSLILGFFQTNFKIKIKINDTIQFINCQAIKNKQNNLQLQHCYTGYLLHSEQIIQIVNLDAINLK